MDFSAIREAFKDGDNQHSDYLLILEAVERFRAHAELLEFLLRDQRTTRDPSAFVCGWAKSIVGKFLGESDALRESVRRAMEENFSPEQLRSIADDIEKACATPAFTSEDGQPF